MSPEMINAGLGVLIVFVALVVWLVRLEGLVKFREEWSKASLAQLNTRLSEIKSEADKQLVELKSAHLETKQDLYKQMQEMSKTMNQILQALSKIQGNIEGSQKLNQ